MANYSNHIVQGIAPVADAYNGDPATDVVNALGSEVLFVIQEGVGTTGTATVTVEACDDIVPTTTTAIPFMYRTNTTGDTWSAWTAATATGFTTTAGSNHIYEILVDPSELAEESAGYVRAQLTEVADAAVLAGVTIHILNPRYKPVASSMLD